MILALIGVNVVVSLLGFRALQEADGKRATAFLFVPYQVARGENGLGMWAEFFRAPDVQIALMGEWESKLEKMADSMST